VLGKVAVDRSLPIDDRVEAAAADAGQMEKKFSTAFSQDAEVGVKWKV
jgi:hypothetical protein